jgi:hypothetical protein
LTFNTAFQATWHLNEKWFFDFSLSQIISDNKGFQSSRQWPTMDWANYRITRQLSMGIGLGGGYVNVDQGTDSTFEQIQGRLNWNPSRRLTVNLNGGIEIRQFTEAPRTDNLINPIMGAGISYQLFDYTSLFVSANSSVDTSIFVNQVSENFGVSAGVNQRLVKHLNLSISGGYRRTDYKGTFVIFNQSFPDLRRDNLSYASVGLSTTFLKKASASVSYTHNENDSTVVGYSYASDQVAFNLGYRF